MPCAESLQAQAYFDGELDALAAVSFERHVEQCAACRALLGELGETRTRLRAELDYSPAPATLRARIARGLDAQSGPRPARRGPPALPPWRSPPFWLGAGGGLVTACAAGLALWFLAVLAPTPLLDELVQAHVRSLMPAHLTDVLSSDHHTVKPWFAGHADVSPVVADFAAQGYRLVGGRADYLEQQRAAVLIYQHGAHVINVFSWTAPRRPLPQFATRRGYHLACWRAADLEYCAVSDAGWDELQGLEQLLRELAAHEAR